MYRYRLSQTQPRTANGRRLQNLMLAYHDFRYEHHNHGLPDEVKALGAWQAERLRRTHRDLYESPGHGRALDFLLDDLYAPWQFTRRDDDVDRIFPHLTRWSPDSALFTLSQLVELNLLSQKFDLAMAQWLVANLNLDAAGIRALDREDYARAYRGCGHEQQRRRQIELVAAVGRDLEQYVENRSLRMALKMMHRPARMAGLGELYQCIHEGVHRFRAIDGVEAILDRVTERETRIMEQILAGEPMVQLRATISSR